MNGKSAIMLILAVVCGLGAMYGTSKMLSKDRDKKPELQEVVLAVRDLKADEMLKEDMVKLAKFDKEDVPAGSFKTVKEVLERGVQIPLLANEPILDAKLAPKGVPAGLVSRIPQGMRAFAIEVNEQTGVSGFILPGHRVDIIQMMAVGPGGPEAEMILQNVPVLASGQTFTRPEDKSILSRTVTLAVTPAQVDTLVAARTKGPLTLSLRGVNDVDVVKVAPKPVPPPPPSEPEPKPVVVARRSARPAAVPARMPRKYLTIIHGMQGFERLPLTGPESNENVQDVYIPEP